MTGTEGKIDQLKGRAKEAAGDATGNDDWKAEGKADRAAGSVKEGADKAAGWVKDKVDGARG